jgi:putative redox protein
MSPYGFVAAGLGACTSMTIRMYARRKGLPLDGISVDVSHNKVHAQDAATGNPSRIDEFTRVIHLKGDLTGEQAAKLLEISDKCPVHRTLEQGARVITRIERESDSG